MPLAVPQWQPECQPEPQAECTAISESDRVSLFYVNDIGSTGSRGRTVGPGFPVYTLHLNSDAGGPGYAVTVTQQASSSTVT